MGIKMTKKNKCLFETGEINIWMRQINNEFTNKEKQSVFINESPV